MKIRHLSVRNFRGIKGLDWYIDRDINCLIGAGDSTKTTILTAINYVFFPNWNLQINDSDFYNHDINNKIEIIATITELPEYLISRFSESLRGVSDGNVLDEPTQASSIALSVKLSIGLDLEPQWSIFTERSQKRGDTMPSLSAKDRQSLSVFKLGGMYDSDFAWSKFSVLSRLINQKDSVRETLRNIKSQTENFPDALKDTAKSVQDACVALGVKAINSFVPGIDTNLLQDSKGIISLHDGEVPLKMKGNGTKRLVALAMQRKLADVGSVITIDEIESGLEPFRLRHLVRQIRESYNEKTVSQVFMTIHSAVALVEFKISEIALVSCNHGDGKVSILNLPIDQDLQKLIRSHDEALLARKLIICEGDTEYSICVGLDNYWCNNDLEYFTYHGAVPTLGTNRNKGGIDEVVDKAPKILNLGFNTAIFVDNDVQPRKTTFEKLENYGIKVFKWENDECTETTIFKYISENGVKKLIKEAVYLNSESQILNTISKSIGITLSTLADIESLRICDEIRAAIGSLAKKDGWYKTRDGGTAVGFIIAEELDNSGDNFLTRQIKLMLNWAKL
jgi:hypothetical protein